MKPNSISNRVSRVARILCRGSLVVLAMLSVGLWIATASTQPTSAAIPQGLPTRPPPPKPKPDRPSKPKSQPTPTLPPPTPTPMLTADLALYPVPFFEHPPVYFVLPENPSPTDLSAAATIATGLGKFSNGEIRLASTLDTQITAKIRDNHHLIVIGEKGTNRFLDQLDLPLGLGDHTLPADQGVIQELVSPWNPMRLILAVTSQSDDGLSKASQALNRKAHLRSMQGTVAIVQSVPPPEPAASYQPDVDSTLVDLGYEDKVAYGVGFHTLTYHFSVPLGFAFKEDARLDLHFSHAAIASSTDSFLDVRFNGIPIASVLLDERNASAGTLSVALPGRLIRPGRNEIRISIAMSLDDKGQESILDAEQLWTAIYDHSSLHLPLTSQDVEPSLDLFLYPFNKRPSLTGLLLVLPDRAGRFEYDLMLQVAASLGAADRGDYLALEVTMADLVSQQDRRDKDLFLIGRPSAHSLIAELNDSLPQPFEPGSDVLYPLFDPVMYIQDPSRDIGLIEELAAPWNPERTILVLTGTSNEGVALAGTVLFSQSNALAGNVAFVEESAGVRTLDTLSLPPTPSSRSEGPAVDQAVLIQLGERWW